jgi:hypothetical protein
MAREIVIEGGKVTIRGEDNVIVGGEGFGHHYVRPVEGILIGPEVVAQYEKLRKDPNRFERSKDGWFRDNFLGKSFAPPSKDKHSSWGAGEEYANSLGAQPEIWEWETLVDRTRHNPAIVKCAEILELKLDDRYWSRTPYAGNLAVAWFVNFYYGYVSNVDKGDAGYVRPVRSQ